MNKVKGVVAKGVYIELSEKEFIALSVLKAKKQIGWREILLAGAKAIK